MTTASDTEVWLRGPLDGYDPLLLPIVHALLQVREDLERLATTVPPAHVWWRPSDAAAIGFHVRHLGGALDRLLTYARGEALNELQKGALRLESDPGASPSSMDELVQATGATIDRALEQIGRTSPTTLLDARAVGRARLPTTVLGLLFHAAEHSTRHAGQAITTARMLSSWAGPA